MIQSDSRIRDGQNRPAPPSATAHAYATLVRALQSASLQHSDMRVMLRHLLVEQKETDVCEERRREHWRREARGSAGRFCPSLVEIPPSYRL